VALGNLKDPGLVGYFRERFANDRSDLVKTDAVRAIGKSGDASTVPFLEQCVAVPSHRNMVGQAATQALEQVRKR
jgi:HEAT repeat protein